MKKQHPDYHGDGYISLAIVYAVLATNWFAPSIIFAIGPKISMILGGVTYSLFIASFFFHVTWSLYLASVLIGFGASLFWTAQGTFLTINSDSETISRNTGVLWALFQFSLLFGNAFLYFAFQKKEIDANTRYLLFGFLFVISCVGILLLCFLKTGFSDSKIPRTVASDGASEFSKAVEEFKKAFKLMTTNKMILLAMTFLYTGFELSFFSGVYGSSIASTRSLGDDAAKYVGLSGIYIGVGEILGGAVFGILGKKTNTYGRDPVILIGYLVHIGSFFLIYLNLPAKSNLMVTTDSAVISSSVTTAMICAFGLGFGDACFNTQIYSILGTLYSDDSAPAFTVFKFIKSLAAAIAFFYSTTLQLPQQLMLLTIFGTIGTCSFWMVEWNDFVQASRAKAGLKAEDLKL